MTRHRADEEYLAHAFRFLVNDFGYVAIGRIPVTTDDVEVRGYVNAAAGLQVEISGHPIGVTFLGGLRRLRGGVPAPYDRDTWLELTDIAMVRQPEYEELLNHNLNPGGWRAVVDAAARLLRDNADLLTGDGWIPRASVAERWKNHFPRTFGWEPDSDELSQLDEFKSHFAFLLDLGYVLAYDTDRLTPHEYGVGEELRYEAGSHRVTIARTDFRDNEWIIERDGQQVGEVFYPFPKEIASRAASIAEELRSRS